MADIEHHPHSLFIPENATVLILGTFPGKNNINLQGRDEWFYSAKRNQFWTILRNVYGKSLQSTHEKKLLFEKKGIAIGDIFLKVRRKENNNSDSSLEVIEYNDKAIAKALENNSFRWILTTSRLVEKEFRKLFPGMHKIQSLPSPSPRYATMSLQEKIDIYRDYLPS